MNVAEKLVTVAESLPKVYDEGFRAGIESDRDEFWTLFQDWGRRKNYSYAFAYGWADETFTPKHKIVVEPGNADYMFLSSGVSTVDETKVDFSRLDVFTGTFEKALTTSVSMDAQSAASMVSTFRAAFYLMDLSIKNLSEACTFDKAFWRAIGITNVDITGVIGQDIDFSDCFVMSRDSIRRVIEVLSETAEGKSIVFSVHAVNQAFETSHDAKDGSTSAEWLSLVATRPNWVISCKDGMYVGI